MNINKELLQFYIYKKLIKRQKAPQLLAECEAHHMGLRDYVLEKEMVDETAELEARAEYYRMPWAQIDMLDIDRSLLDQLSYDFMKKHKIIPVRQDSDGTIVLAVGKPLDCHARSALATRFLARFDCILVPPGQIDRYIDSLSAMESTRNAIDDLHAEQTGKTQAAVGAETALSAESDVINNPAVRLVDSIIKEAVPFRASDIHIEPFEHKVRVRYRVDGDLQERAEFPIEAYSAICARLKIMSGLNIAERRVPQDGRIHMTIGGRDYDFRVSTLPTVFGEKFVIRVLDKTAFQFTREDLGFSPEENKLVDKMLSRPHGIILLTGPTGCGKSTTLYSFLQEINRPHVNIVTVEDPVEYSIAGVNQTQVNVKANMTFATALRSILRQDPDVIMIGEIRDEETAEIAVRSAITGHIVFSTLHTNDAPGAITRLEDMKVKDYLIADALVGVIAQRLVKKLCPVCKKRGRTNAREMEILGITEPITIARPQGCQFCNNTGYKGRVAVHEMMYMNDRMKNAVTTEKNGENLRKLAEENGMVPLWNCCRELVCKGVTSLQELMSLHVE